MTLEFKSEGLSYASTHLYNSPLNTITNHGLLINSTKKCSKHELSNYSPQDSQQFFVLERDENSSTNCF